MGIRPDTDLALLPVTAKLRDTASVCTAFVLLYQYLVCNFDR